MQLPEAVQESGKRIREFIQRIVVRWLLPHLQRLWNNPLFKHARRAKPLPLRQYAQYILFAALAGAALTLLAWLTNFRVLGALLVFVSLGGVLAPLIAAPVAGADRVSRQMWRGQTDPRKITDIAATEVAWGLTLVTLWQLRWLILIAIALTPTLMIGVLRLDAGRFLAWHASAVSLGGATPGARAAYLLPDGGVPYFRLVLRTLSAGFLPWFLLPLLTAGGVAAALKVEDAGLSSLIALLGTVVLLPLLYFLWAFLSLTALLAGPFEILRILLYLGLHSLCVYTAVLVARLNAELIAPQEQDARPFPEEA